MRTLLFILLWILTIHLVAQPKIFHTPLKQYIGKVPKEYFFADSVSLRAQPSLTGKFLNYIPLNTACYVIETNEEHVTINGVISHWCKVKIEDETYSGIKEGWVWGGFLAYEVFGSNEDSDVRFLISFTRSKETLIEGSDFIRSFVKIKAVKEHAMLDELEVEYNQTYIEARIDGKRGVEDIHDILYLHTPCVGGCGCYTGDQIIFWDGENLTNVFFSGGSPDGNHSSGEMLIFPSEAEGEKGYIIKTMFGPDDDFVPADEENVYRTFYREQYLEWKNGKLIEAKGKKVKNTYFYYDRETNERVDR